jgi:hypothetical protein
MFPTLYNPDLYPGSNSNYGMNLQEPIKKFNDSKSNLITYTLLFFLIVFFIIIVVLLFVNTTTRSKLIAPENCPMLKSEYAVIPEAKLSSLSIINQCSGNPDGYQGSQPCTFSNISTVYEAQQLCNKYSNSICSAFAYDPTTSIINFVNGAYNISTNVANSEPVDVYLKQNI